jgi:hypothetical protein
MENIINKKYADSPFKGLEGLEYFDFEEDFVEENVRCIPMIVRFKLDAAGIKLNLAEWAKFAVDEKVALSLMPCESDREKETYHYCLASLIKKYTGNEATPLKTEATPAWANLQEVPAMLQQKAAEFKWHISIQQWQRLTNLQRFALTKLYRPGHENKNFPKAMREFGLTGE